MIYVIGIKLVVFFPIIKYCNGGYIRKNNLTQNNKDTLYFNCMEGK